MQNWQQDIMSRYGPAAQTTRPATQTLTRTCQQRKIYSPGFRPIAPHLGMPELAQTKGRGMDGDHGGHLDAYTFVQGDPHITTGIQGTTGRNRRPPFMHPERARNLGLDMGPGADARLELRLAGQQHQQLTVLSPT